MVEKVNPSHPDKVADRIAGALVDLAYSLQENPKVAIEVLIGHGICHIINETSVSLSSMKVAEIVSRIAGQSIRVDYKEVPQDAQLANNQKEEIRCGDNGIFLGVPITPEQRQMIVVTKDLYKKWPSDGKYIIDDGKIIVCQSNAKSKAIEKFLKKQYGSSLSDYIINPLGDWTGGTDVDTGATNRKLGSDMFDSITGGGLHGKDLSKGDVSINIYAWLKAQTLNRRVKISCAIGDIEVDGRPYKEIVEIARDYIQKIGGFEKFAEYGLCDTKGITVFR
jgi:S-adenosylmethionine synthetase